jgi:hypothetical protein
MPLPYNDNDVLKDYPLQINQIIKFIKTWVASVLYPDEDYATLARKKFFLAELTTEHASIKNLRRFFNSQVEFPFSIWNVVNSRIDESRIVHGAKSYNCYVPEVGDYMSAIPKILEVPMITFTNTNRDHFTFMKKLQDYATSLIRLDLPITIGDDGYTDTYTVDFVIPEVVNGDIAMRIKEWEDLGKFNDLVFNFEVKYMEYSLVGGRDPDNGGKIAYPVDNICYYLRRSLDESLIYSGEIPDTLTIVSTDPADDETSVPVDQNIIINFNNQVKESTMEDNFSILPSVEGKIVSSQSGFIMGFEPYADLTSGTVYNVTINKDITDIYNGNLEDDVTFNFTTI